MQARIAQIQAVHQKVVIVAGCDVPGLSEEVTVSASEVDEAAAILIELGVLQHLGKAVAIVGEDLACETPRTERRRRFEVPDLPESRRFAVALLRDHDPALTVVIPLHGVRPELEAIPA